MFRYLLYLNILLNVLSLFPDSDSSKKTTSQVSQWVCGQLQLSIPQDQKGKMSSAFSVSGVFNSQTEYPSHCGSTQNPFLLKSYVYQNFTSDLFKKVVFRDFSFSRIPRAPPQIA